MITPNSGIAPFLAPNRNKLTVPHRGIAKPCEIARSSAGVLQSGWFR